MKVYVATCDKYDHLLQGFARQFNKYWAGDQIVDVLGFRLPSPLPGNFVFHQLEPVETQAWTTNLQRFFARQQEPYFTFLLEDYWLTRDVDQTKVSAMEEFVKAGAVKGDLSRNTNHFAHTDLGNGYVRATSTAKYRTSTQPCIWSKQYMLSLLTPGLNPWQFELQCTPAISAGDIIGSQQQIYEFANIMFKGSPAGDMINRLNAEDRKALRQMGAFDGLSGQWQEVVCP